MCRYVARLPFGSSRDRGEKHGVGPGDNVIALGQSVDFHCVGCLPEIAIRTLAEFLVFGEFTGVRVEGVPVECHDLCARFRRSGVSGIEGL